MKIRNFLVFGAALAAVQVLAQPMQASAHGNNGDHINHDIRRQQDDTRHDAGIPWRLDRSIHGQERQQHRVDHQSFNSGFYNQSFANGYTPAYNSYENQFGSNYSGSGLGAGLRNFFGMGNSYPANQIYPMPAYGRAPYGAPYNVPAPGAYSYDTAYGITNAAGHVNTPDGHRLDHHGNHDDAPGNL